MWRGKMTNKIKLGKEEFLIELKDTVKHMKLLLNEVINNGNISYAKQLSVDLRKLFSPTKGNNLLSRLEKLLQIKLVFPDRSETLPPKTIYVGLNEYRNRLVFTLQGRTFTRLKLINLVAGQKGAHTDEVADKLHYQSEKILLPLGNLARGGILLQQNVRYLVEIAQTTLDITSEQVKTEQSNN